DITNKDLASQKGSGFSPVHFLSSDIMKLRM
ncbi:hypothetical protein A2U01_0047029, partial [Trifolium medium]|nr:hypothetical protein [Trifolium medium]